MTTPFRKTSSPRQLACLVMTLFAFAFSAVAFADSNRCLSANALAGGGFKTSTVVFYGITGPTVDANFNSTFTYQFEGLDPSATSVDGVPGLITYCVYPAQPPGNPQSTTPNTGAIAMDINQEAFGADGSAFVQSDNAVGSFSWSRAKGDPSNIAFDGLLYTMGSATWYPTNCSTATGVLVCTPVSPASQTILTHINDPGECSSLYGAGGTTCWVYPTPLTVCQPGDSSCNTPPPPTCNGNPACKTADISNAVTGEVYGTLDASGYVIVPPFTQLNIDYSYVIINQPGNTSNMYFKVPTPKISDINDGGGKDYFGCEQVPQTLAWTNYPNFVPGWDLNLIQGGGTCNQSRFTFTAYGGPQTLTPGQFVAFDLGMQTRLNVGKGKTAKYEYTTCGLHLLNSGFTVKWFPEDPVTLKLSPLTSFSTSGTPIYVDVQGCK